MNAREIEAYVDAAAAALALPIATEYRAGVLFYFALAASLAEVVQAVPLGPHDDPAGVFIPVSPIAPTALIMPITLTPSGDLR